MSSSDEKRKRYAVYLDWENLWIPHVKMAFPHLHRANPSVPIPNSSREEQSLLYELPELLNQQITEQLKEAPRFTKAVAVWENLDHGRELMPRLRQVGINPIQSLGKIFHSSGRQTIKEASDRALILKVVEDVMLRPHAELDAVVLGTGDFGFVPLIEFLMEHTKLDVFVLSFSGSLSGPLRAMISSSFAPEHVMIVDNGPRYIEFEKRCAAVRATTGSAEKLATTNPEPTSEDDIKVDDLFLETLVLGLSKSKMPHVTRWLLENRWFPKWEASASYSAPASELLDRAIAAGYVAVFHTEDDKDAIELNKASSRVAAILSRAQ